MLPASGGSLPNFICLAVLVYPPHCPDARETGLVRRVEKEEIASGYF